MTDTNAFEAIRQGDVATLEAILTRDPDQAHGREAGISALLTALYHRQASAAESIRSVLRSTGVDLDLFEAAAIGDAARVRAILADEPDLVGAHSADGFTALHLACFFDRLETCEVLLDAGSSVADAAHNPSAVQPLHSAAAARSADIVRKLIAAGSDVDAAQQGGWTALMAAAMHGDRGMVMALLAAGADPTRRSDDGKTAADLADPSVADLLASPRHGRP